MGTDRLSEVVKRPPSRAQAEVPKVLQVLTASQTYPRAAGPPVLRKMRLVLFDATRANRDRRTSFIAQLVRSQQGSLGRLLARVLSRGAGGAARLTRELADERPRLVHCLSGTAALSLLRSWEQGAPRTPFVMSMTGTDLGRAVSSRWWGPRLGNACRLASRVLVDGSGSADELRRLGCEPAKVEVLRSPVDVHFVRPEGPRTAAERARDPRLHVLYCGPFVERQGIAFALEAVARLAGTSPGVFLRMLGAGPFVRPARAIADHLGIAEHVEISPPGDTAAVAAALRRSDVLVCPSLTASDGDRETGAPPAVLLAMAAAVPVVATRHADNAETIADLRTGLLAEERDVGSLFDALARVREDPELARGLGLAGRALVEEEHDARKIYARLEDIYWSCID
jgi:glycosyltransferase involved in cell wall biosynthesis